MGKQDDRWRRVREPDRGPFRPAFGPGSLFASGPVERHKRAQPEQCGRDRDRHHRNKPKPVPRPISDRTEVH
jgi:hypothetical protein